jgi:hypothetical protein
MSKPGEQLKYEIAAELGLLPKVERYGWKSLTARESGRIGGLMRGKAKTEPENPGGADATAY